MLAFQHGLQLTQFVLHNANKMVVAAEAGLQYFIHAVMGGQLRWVTCLSGNPPPLLAFIVYVMLLFWSQCGKKTFFLSLRDELQHCWLFVQSTQITTPVIKKRLRSRHWMFPGTCTTHCFCLTSLIFCKYSRLSWVHKKGNLCYIGLLHTGHPIRSCKQCQSFEGNSHHWFHPDTGKMTHWLHPFTTHQLTYHGQNAHSLHPTNHKDGGHCNFETAD